MTPAFHSLASSLLFLLRLLLITLPRTHPRQVRRQRPAAHLAVLGRARWPDFCGPVTTGEYALLLEDARMLAN
jgi:hypothetical protein